MNADSRKNVERLRIKWLAEWPKALAAWSRFSKLSPPYLCTSTEAAGDQGLTGSFAMIRLQDHAVVIDLERVHQARLGDFAMEILAHEIGHHIYCPANLDDHARCLVHTRRGLPSVEGHAPMIANLYTDLLINDRLKRTMEFPMDEIYRRLLQTGSSTLWLMYLRIYEILWSMPRNSLCRQELQSSVEFDASLGARLVRVYRGDWLRGAARFAMLCLPYLMEEASQCALTALQDTKDAGKGGVPRGLSNSEATEETDAIHPSDDPLITGSADGEEEADASKTAEMGTADGETGTGTVSPGQAAPTEGQAREPFRYGEILNGMGIHLSPAEVAIRYYREQAMPHLIEFPEIIQPKSSETQLEGFDVWEVGDAPDEVDWFQTALRSPTIIPGYTTLEPYFGMIEDHEPERDIPDLDLYVDSSGSMPNPQVTISYLALAGAIVALSALRAGVSVQATLWSGTREFKTTSGFVRNEEEILGIITGHIGGATAFPLHVLRDTYEARKNSRRKTHILVISDNGVDTMYAADEHGTPGWKIAQEALNTAGAGGTLALNFFSSYVQTAIFEKMERQGWRIFPVTNWEELTAFAREFSQQKYGAQP